jgi:integrase
VLLNFWRCPNRRFLVCALSTVPARAVKGQRPYWPGQPFKTHINPVARAAGLPHIGWHGFCHTVSAWGKEAGLDLEEVKTLLRHENVATTSNVHGGLGLDAKRQIQARLITFVKRQTAGMTDGAKAQGRGLPN